VLRFGSTAAQKRRGEGVETQELSADDLRTLPDLVRMSAGRFGAKVALQIPDNGGWYRLSYNDILHRAGLMGAVWRQAGLERGQRVVLMSENHPDWAVAYFAAQSVGATVVPLDTHTPSEEVEQILEFTEARALLASRDLYPHLPKALRSSPLPIWNINDSGLPFVDSGGPRPEPPSAEQVRWEELSTDDVATIIFTSGPAVDPRGVMLTHRNFLSDLLALSEVLRSYETDRFVSVLPLHHALEFTGGLLMPLFSGALVTYSQTLKSKLLLELMEQTGATALLAVPRIFELLYDRLKRGMDGSGSEQSCRELDSFASRMRLLVSGGAPLDHSISEAFASIGTPIHEGYGLTETAPIVTVNPLWGIRPRSVGKTLPGVELKLDSPGPDGEGEIVVRGPNVMKGYYKNPKATAHFLRDGWLYTGDLGRMDADGYLTITGRSKELIVTGAGKNVWPEEIELFYREMEGVNELAVFGLRPPGATRESVHAALHISVDEDLVRKQMHNISRTRPTYQRIQRAHFTSRPLPRDAQGRLDRKALRRAALEELTAARSAPRAGAALSMDAPWWERDAIALISRVAARPDDEPVVPRDSLAELLDSLQAVELLATLEGHFGLSLQDDELAALERVSDVLERIKQAVGDRVEGIGTPSPATADEGGYWATMIASASEPGTETISPLGASAVALPLQAAFLGAAGLMLRTAWRLSVRGLDKLPTDTPYLVAANHCSHFDTASMLTALRGSTHRVHVLGARDYFFRSPASAWFFRNMLNVIPFDRDRNFVEGFRACRQVIRPDEPILIFPEGTRSISGRLQPFKVGLGILALELGTPVVPARIRGSYEALPKGRSWPRLSRIEVAFGEPVPMTPYLERRDRTNTYEIYREVVNEVRQRIEQLIAQG
jgi:long-chain acyl-CoA synthetase